MDKELDELELADICMNVPVLKKNLAGVLPRGYYPDTFQVNSFFIWNNQLDDSYGDHWLLVYYLKDETIFYDSFGLSEVFYNYMDIVERAGVPCTRNTRFIQTYFPVPSTVCGHHCIYMAYQLSKHIKFKVITEKLYSQNTSYNDKMVTEFVDQLRWKYLNVNHM